MIDMTVLINQLLQLFILICLGYFVFKIGIFNEDVNKHINSLIIKVTMPCMIVNSVLSMTERPDPSIVGALFAVSIGFFLVMPIIAFVIVKLMKKTTLVESSRQGAYMFMLIFSNFAFMGMPILQAACGQQGSTAVFYAAILNIFFNLSVFSYGVLIIGYGNTVKTTLKLKNFISPGIISAIIAFVFYIFDIHFTGTIGNTISTIGGLTSPLAMMLIGSTLASMKLKEVFNEWRIYVFSVIKQIVLPILMYPLFRLIIKDDLLFNVIFIEFMMPVANLALMIANEQKLDNKFVSKTIFISTLMSLVTIPLVFYLCRIIYA